MSVPAFTDDERILTLVGQLGITLRTDDNDPGLDEADYLAAAVESGTNEVYFYLSAYDPTAAAASEWVRNHATWFAVKYLCQRRLNDVPKTVLDECERREKQLQLVLDRKVPAPGIPKSRRGAVVTNYKVDLRLPNNQIRVDTTRSTGVAQNYKRPTDPSAPDER